MSEPKQYAERDHRALGDHYLRHVSAMTAEGLHAKSAIAAELAWRDERIAAVTRERDEAREAFASFDALFRGVRQLRDEAMKERDEAAKERDALRAEVERLTRALKLVLDQDQGCGGTVTEAEAWRSAQSIARAALKEPTP